MNLLDWLPTVILAAIAVAVFAGRHFIKAWIERGMEHRFATRIETLRTELHNKEEAFKGELRANELEISTLRADVLSGRANRQALFDKRRIEAVDKLWAAFVALGPYRGIAASMAIINVEKIGEITPKNPAARQLFEMISKQAPAPAAPQSYPDCERPFISPLAWAYFSSYRTIVFGATAQAKVLEIGIDQPEKFINAEAIKAVVKAVLPHQTAFIEQHGINTYYYLLDELENKFLDELKNILAGKEVDKENIQRSTEIMETLKKASAEKAGG